MEISDSDNNDNDSDVEYIPPCCCSCSKLSSCKTNRCQCRAAGHDCTISCRSSKCSNKEDNANESSGHVGNTGNITEGDETEGEKNHTLASHGAMLLQTAFSDKAETKDEVGSKRKPLSDIGNTLVRQIT